MNGSTENRLKTKVDYYPPRIEIIEVDASQVLAGSGNFNSQVDTWDEGDIQDLEIFLYYYYNNNNN